MIKRSFFLILLLTLVPYINNVGAQNLIVKKFYHAERDFTAISGSTLVIDQNNEPCALIKVRTMYRGFTFDASRLFPIKKTEEQGGAHPLDIYVWVQSGAKRFSIGHPQFGVISEYELNTTLQAGQTYILELETNIPQNGNKQKRTSQYVVFQLTPSDAVVELDGQMLKTTDGTARKLMSFGSYNYIIKAPDYKSSEGSIEINDPENPHIVRANLKPNFTQVTLSVPDSAEIWVNGEQKGYGQWTGNLGEGEYIFETKKNGHRDSQCSITIDPDAGPQTLTLTAPTPIIGEADIDSEPALADIYFDGRLIGQTPRLVPNLPVGSHTVKLVRSGYDDYTCNITIKEGETATITATLKHQETDEDRLQSAYEMYKRHKEHIEENIREKGLLLEQMSIKLEGMEKGKTRDSLIILKKSAERDYKVLMDSLKVATKRLEQKKKELTLAVKKANTKPFVQKKTTTPDSILVFNINSVEFTMVKVEAGSFIMGTNSGRGNDLYKSEKPAHKVIFAKDYYIGQTEVTQALWLAVMGSNPSHFKGDNLPVEQVSWDDCQAFITQLSSLTGTHFRLPTEAEWEYAARGGNKNHGSSDWEERFLSSRSLKLQQGYKYSGSNILDELAWYDRNSESKTHEVGMKLANELGLYDMSGNVSEWCADYWGVYSSNSVTNPMGPSSGSSRVIRGGSWRNTAGDCRVSGRSDYPPGIRFNILGLRLAM